MAFSVKSWFGDWTQTQTDNSLNSTRALSSKNKDKAKQNNKSRGLGPKPLAPRSGGKLERTRKKKRKNSQSWLLTQVTTVSLRWAGTRRYRLRNQDGKKHSQGERMAGRTGFGLVNQRPDSEQEQDRAFKPAGDDQVRCLQLALLEEGVTVGGVRRRETAGETKTKTKAQRQHTWGGEGTTEENNSRADRDPNI